MGENVDMHRADVLRSVLPPSPSRDAVIQHVVNGNSQSPLPDNVPQDLLQRAKLANWLVDISNEAIMKKIMNDPSVQTPRDVAFQYNATKLKSLVDQDPILGGTKGPASSVLTSPGFDVASFQRKTFQAEPSAVVHQLVAESKVFKI